MISAHFMAGNVGMIKFGDLALNRCYKKKLMLLFEGAQYTLLPQAHP